jgi:uncharacterized membrane protein
MTEETKTATTTISKTRLEILFDGVFAIAMTILVLEIKTPELSDRHSISEMAQALREQVGTIFSYLLSFTVLGIMWYRHNYLYRHFHRITAGMFALHILMLASAAFFPFCAALMGRYPTNLLTMVIYSGCIMIYNWASLASWLVAKRTDSFSPDFAPSTYHRIWRRTLRGGIVLTILFFMCIFNAWTR